jgi:hypothetical protein
MRDPRADRGRGGRRKRAGAARAVRRIALRGAALCGPLLAAAGAAALDLADVTPSSLLQEGDIELKTFHSVYTQTSSFDADGTRRDEPRSTYYTGILSMTAGTGGAWNPGVELTLRSVDNRAYPADTRTRTTLTAVAPRIRLAPFRSLPAVALETGVRIPVAHDLEGTDRVPYLDWADPVWITRLLWDLRLGGNWTAWAEAGTQLRADLGSGDAQLTTPVQVLWNWWPHRDWTVYVPLGIAPDWFGDARGHYWSQTGLGLKFRPAGHVELEVLGTVLPAGRGAGAGTSVSVGMRLAP